MVLRRRAMSDVLLAAIMVAFFVLAIGLVRVLGRMIDHDTDHDGFADEPPDTSGAGDQWGRPQ
jgi:uncharacterized membrane protein